MEGSGGGGVVSGTPGDEREEPEVPPGVVGVVGVALRPLLVDCVASGVVCGVLAIVKDGFLFGVESSCSDPKEGAVSKLDVTGYNVVGVTSW